MIFSRGNLHDHESYSPGRRLLDEVLFCDLWDPVSEVSAIFSNLDTCVHLLSCNQGQRQEPVVFGESVKHELSKDRSNKHAKLGKKAEKMKLQPCKQENMRWFEWEKAREKNLKNDFKSFKRIMWVWIGYVGSEVGRLGRS